MDKKEIAKIFFKQDKICFSKGYKEFEEVYEELKDVLKLKRKIDYNNPWPMVVITKGGE